MFNNFSEAKDWFNRTYRRFSVEEDFDCIVIYISIDLIYLRGFCVGFDEYPYKLFDTKHDFVIYCDVLKKLHDMGVDYFESEY